MLKNNVPRYLVIDFTKADREKTASDGSMTSISERLIQENMEVYRVLAKGLSERKNR